jgi:hypothetical protein
MDYLFGFGGGQAVELSGVAVGGQDVVAQLMISPPKSGQ